MKEVGHEQPFKEEENTGGRRGDDPRGRGGDGINKAKEAVICRLCSQVRAGSAERV